MPAARSAPIVERRSLDAKRVVTKPDDLRAARHHRDHARRRARNARFFPDMLHLLRRLSGRLAVVADRLKVTAPKLARPPRTRLAGLPTADHAAIVAGVFGHGPGSAPQRRETTRTVTSRKGKAVCVVEWPSRMQLELTLG